MILLTVCVDLMGLGHHWVGGRFPIAFGHFGGPCCCAVEVVAKSMRIGSGCSDCGGGGVVLLNWLVRGSSAIKWVQGTK